MWLRLTCTFSSIFHFHVLDQQPTKDEARRSSKIESETQKTLQREELCCIKKCILNAGYIHVNDDIVPLGCRMFAHVRTQMQNRRLPGLFLFLFYHTSHAELLGGTPSPWMRGGWIVVRHVCVSTAAARADCWSQLALQACSRNLTARRWTHSCTTHWNKHGCSFISEISKATRRLRDNFCVPSWWNVRLPTCRRARSRSS